MNKRIIMFILLIVIIPSALASYTLRFLPFGDSISISQVNTSSGSDIYFSVFSDWVYVNLSSNYSTSSNVSSNVGLNFTPQANKNYDVQVYYMVRTSLATDSPRPGINWSSGLLDGVAFIQAPALQTVVQANCNINTVCIAPVGGLDFSNSSYGGTITSIFQTGASNTGNFEVTLASEVLGTTVMMMKGSYIKYKTY